MQRKSAEIFSHCHQLQLCYRPPWTVATAGSKISIGLQPFVYCPVFPPGTMLSNAMEIGALHISDPKTQNDIALQASLFPSSSIRQRSRASINTYIILFYNLSIECWLQKSRGPTGGWVGDCPNIKALLSYKASRWNWWRKNLGRCVCLRATHGLTLPHIAG